MNESGQTVIPGSRRPDGTYRKDVRVKAGYVPQDEQPTYQSRGTIFKQGVPRVPGMDDSEVKSLKASAKTKAAKKNEKRKQKKTSEGAPDGTTSGRKSGEDVAQQFQTLELAGDQKEGEAAENEASSSSPLERKAKTLRKKIKQAEVLTDRRQAGEKLTEQEAEKVQKAATWKSELEELEAVADS